MKNKRTKLTALLLSALMAVSTISSVTWAADLFSDGSDETEVVVADPVDDVVENDVAEDAELTGISVDTVSTVKFAWNKDKTKVQATFTFSGSSETKVIDAVETEKISETCLAPAAAKYTATLEYGAGKFVVSSSDTQVDNATVTCDNELKNWTDTNNQKALGEHTSETGWIVHPDVKKVVGHTIDSRLVNEDLKVILPGNCETVTYVYYKGCTTCKKYFSTTEGSLDIGTDVSKIDWETKSEDASFSKIERAGSGHVYDLDHPIIMTNEYYDMSTRKYNEKGGYVNENKLNGMDEFCPYGCTLVDGKMVADNPQDPGDAYYYTVVKCKNCNTVKSFGRTYLKDTEGEIAGENDGDFYEEVSGGNVIGFLAKYDPTSTNDEILLFSEGKGLHHNRRGIKTDDSRLVQPVVPVLSDETKVGRYVVRSYENDVDDYVDQNFVDVDRQDNFHTWGRKEVAKKDMVYTFDGTKSATEDKNLLTGTDINLTQTSDPWLDKNISNGFVVVRDANGNVVEAKSKNCITTAKYELYQTCVTCGKTKKVETKTAPYNDDVHSWGKWNKPDDADNKYYYIDEDTHRKVTYYNRTCSLCGKRNLQLAKEYDEPHSFEEKKVEGGPEQDPSCGVDGFYTVQLQCACEYKDESSTKRTSIPATDKHDFGTNPVEVLTFGSIQIRKNGGVTLPDTDGDNLPDTLEVVVEDGVYKVDGLEDPFNVYAVVVRKCNICGKYDSNGINNIAPATGKVGVDPSLFIDTPIEGRTVEVTAEALKDPNGIPYSCSAGKATITFDWSGKVDGIAVRPESQPLTIENVPYYTSMDAYRGRTDHKPEVRQEIITKPTATQEGSAIEITKCSVCGEELSRVDVPIAKLGSAPAVKAVAVNYNTVTVTWDAVEGAESYKVYNKSNVLGISKWQLVATVDGTSYTDTGLVTGAKYRYTVKAVVNGHGGEYSKTGAVVSPKLTAPEIKSVTSVGSNKNKVTWTKVDGASGYIVQRKTADGNWTRIATVRGGSNIKCRDKKAAAGASYRVRAFRTVEKPNFVKSNVYGPFSEAK